MNDNINQPHTVTLTEGQISTILWTMEGYLSGSDDYDENSEYGKDVNEIFKVLEDAVDKFYDAQNDEPTYVVR
tara:strand:+ start:360 stop:578 length:219 start_codon:yes stop_codon:yes gene_type:complete